MGVGNVKTTYQDLQKKGIWGYVYSTSPQIILQEYLEETMNGIKDLEGILLMPAAHTSPKIVERGTKNLHNRHSPTTHIYGHKEIHEYIEEMRKNFSPEGDMPLLYLGSEYSFEIKPKEKYEDMPFFISKGLIPQHFSISKEFNPNKWMFPAETTSRNEFFPLAYLYNYKDNKLSEDSVSTMTGNYLSNVFYRKVNKINSRTDELLPFPFKESPQLTLEKSVEFTFNDKGEIEMLNRDI